MGRGRQKAKQTKVARKLKYFSPDTDLEALQRELSSHGASTKEDPYAQYAQDEDDEYVDPYAPVDDEDEVDVYDERFWTQP
ncbi:MULTISPECIES: DUF3073 domain-containing protein [unclassified Schaalia]|uniref:DUF3073 domain-containing protein n=1 Tax=unclassified Schaalia TaxID=2691889 RepID=UPI001E432E1C|nr:MULTISPECIES: DUF3073 domain-containing protein [unclassified Schaalia]MCD4548887.1 DUF3073 domain-containing protein [Schaalia sp. lx-260]MCD4557503.1 DUF3073 domain-containing protein [Schaalia sp. lx-100]